MKIILLIILICFCGCEKNEFVDAPASLNIINGIDAGHTIQAKFRTNDNDIFYKGSMPGNTINSVNYGASRLYARQAGPFSLSVVYNTDTTKYIYTDDLNLKSGEICSLFIFGDTLQPDNLFIQDKIPYLTDSSSGLRFVNICKSKSSFIIKTQIGTEGDFPTLEYGQASVFKTFSATSSSPLSYNFTIINQVTGDSLGTYSWQYIPFKNNTVLISGDSSLEFFSLNNY